MAKGYEKLGDVKLDVAMGLAFGKNIAQTILLSGDNYEYKKLAKHDIEKGEQVEPKDLDSFYEVDKEPLVKVGHYSSKNDTVLFYSAKYVIKNDCTLFYTTSGNLLVKTSESAINATKESPTRVIINPLAGKFNG